MEAIVERVPGRVGSGWLAGRLHERLAKAWRRAGKAREERRAERDLIRFSRAMAGMSDHLRRDVGLSPRLFHAHFARFERFD